MNSQGVSRKRPAPGASPAVPPQLGPIPNYPPNPGSQLSNDQFLQWGQNPSSNVVNPASFPDASSFNPAAFPTNQDVAAAIPTTGPSNQLARRQPVNQIVSRNRAYEAPSASSFTDHGGGTGESGAWGESLDELYQRALVAKREAQAKRKQIPPFVQKLSSFLDESKNTDLIRWSDDGNSFIVLDEDEFAKTLIPELFKHNNYASFVRQLNMYGFHKKVGLSDNSMRASERKNKSPSEYANPYFKRGHPDLLWLIQKPRNAAGQGAKSAKGNTRVKAEEGDENEGDDYADDNANASRDDRARPRGQLSLITGGNLLPKEQLAGVYRELQNIRQQQQVISNTITKLRREHEQLYAQAANFQEQHTRHENSINAILTFLATVYNRSLQGDGAQNIASSFAGAISQDPGNVVDMSDDYSLSTLGASLHSPGTQRTMKKPPLLLKAPPASDHHSRAATLSPSVSSSYEHPPSRNSHVRQPSASQSGHVEEVFDNSPQQKNVAPSPNDRAPQRDIMSVIQNSNARNGVPPTSFADFPNVLSSLETAGGNVPLTPNQRADMLRLMANETSSADPNVSVSGNNALVTPTPPPMPQNYSGRLANTRAEIDNLVKMQAQQDRSVQNLTNLLQPLSPTGTIPGMGSGTGSVPPPPLDLDQIFNNDYFTDIGDLDSNKNPLDFGDSTAPATAPTAEDSTLKDANDLFDFDHIPDNGDLFEGSTPANQGNFFGGFDGAGYGNNPVGSGLGTDSKVGGNNTVETPRIVEALTDSEATSPANTVEENPMVSAEGGKGNGGNTKRRKKA